MSKSRTLDTTEKVKALIRVILEPPAEQTGLGFDIEDPAVVREFLKLQKAVKTPAQDLTAIALDESALDNIRQMTPGRAEELANLLDSIADTAKALKRVALEAQMA